MTTTEKKSTGYNYVRSKKRLPDYDIRQAIADDFRLRILNVLLKCGPLSPKEIQKAIDTRVEDIWLRLKQLKTAKLIVTQDAGRRPLYVVNPAFRAYLASVMAWSIQLGNAQLEMDVKAIAGTSQARSEAKESTPVDSSPLPE